MKKIILAAMALAALAACSKEATVDVNQEVIAFGNAFVNKATKGATDPSYTTSSLDAFKVYGAVQGVNIFNGNNVTKGESEYSTEAWSCDGPDQYWVEGANYIFDAVVDPTDVVTDQTTGLPITLKYTAANQTDMLHNRVTTVGQPEDNNGLVTFEFTHLLSKVKLTVENTSSEQAENYRYTVTDITLTNTYAKGDYAVLDGTWSNQTVGSFAIPNMTIASATTVECEKEVLLIPGASIGISFKVNAEIEKTTSEGTTWVTLTTTPVTKSNVVTLAANTAYNFNVSVAIGGQIEFTAKPLPSWTSEPITVYPEPDTNN